MDSHDKEFEIFLRQFELRRPRPPFQSEVSKMNPARRRWWAIATAAVIVVAALGGLLVRIVSLDEIASATVEMAGDSSFSAGERIASGHLIQSGQGQALTLTLMDGSSVEMRPQSSVSIETVKDGLRVRLEDGAIVVAAASRRTGHLYVITHDAQVSVQGTIFIVEAQAGWTRVGVIEGEVEIRSGAIVKTVLIGEQFSSDPILKEQPLTEAVAWSRRAEEFKALLPAPPIVAFTPDLSERLVRKETIPPQASLRRPASAQQLRQDPAPPPSPAPPPAPSPAPQPDGGRDSDGVQILKKACGLCHAVDAVKDQHFDNREAYAALVSGQIALGAPVTQSEFNILVDYLFRTYGVRRAR